MAACSSASYLFLTFPNCKKYLYQAKNSNFLKQQKARDIHVLNLVTYFLLYLFPWPFGGIENEVKTKTVEQNLLTLQSLKIPEKKTKKRIDKKVSVICSVVGNSE